jgi:hypothetical protein
MTDARIRRRTGSAAAGLLLTAALGVLSACTETRHFLSPPDVRGGPVRIADASGDRVYLLTTQWQKRQLYNSGRAVSRHGRTVAQVNVDLWAFDAATARPVFRRRIREAKINGDAAAMGVDQGVMWARLPELVGIRLSDGEIVADRERIGARNPALANLLPLPPEPGTFLTQEMQPLEFTADAGLVIRLDDARRVRIDPATLRATPYEPPREKSRDSGTRAPLGAGRVVIESMAQGMEWRAMVRGLVIDKPGGGNEWLALLAESELSQLKSRRPTVGAQMDFSEPRRHRLYRVGLRPVEDFFGKRLAFGEAQVLPESPDFLMAGLLTQDRPSYREQGALWRRNPDSVFVLSRDRLGDSGRLQLARVTGPSGRPAWTTALPLSNLSGWLPGERHAVMIGPAPGLPQPPTAEEDENAPLHLLSVDLDTGALQAFDLGQNRGMPAIGGKDPS